MLSDFFFFAILPPPFPLLIDFPFLDPFVIGGPIGVGEGSRVGFCGFAGVDGLAVGEGVWSALLLPFLSFLPFLPFLLFLDALDVGL